MTLNCWGLPLLTPQKNRRLDEIAKLIKTQEWDVVALQEVWLKSDQERIIKALGFQYHAQFNGDAKFLGSGMMILSKYKILKSDFYPYRVAGFPHRFNEGDFHSTKGVGYALVETPMGPLPIFVTHLIANYERKSGHDTNRVFRIAQVLELAFYIRRMAAPQGFVLCGDMNATSNDVELETLYALFGVGPEQRNKLKSDRKNIDHIIVGATMDRTQFQLNNVRLIFKNSIGSEKLAYSDHLGLSAQIRTKDVPVENWNTHHVLEKALRYLRFTTDVVKVIENRISWIPVLGHLSNHYMRPQLAFIDALLGMLETDIKMARHSKKKNAGLKIS